jgi:thiamine monophosphate kinase
MVLGAGADFQLVGTIASANLESAPELLKVLHIIGNVTAGEGLFTRGADGVQERHTPHGWNYFSEHEDE